ncbi:hypothetical protein ALP75_205130 [Pseudomonas syringae pv. actinidiae]|nr:hypothetical protein ALP75_205130 [Pseudomonas syringae pv. actinidiae]
MDVAGALLECVLEQPVDDVDDVRVVGVWLLVTGTELEQLLKVAHVAHFLLRRIGTADRLRQPEKLHRHALDVSRVGDHTLDLQLEHVRQVRFP